VRLTVLAATGGIGARLLEQALAVGHDVTAVARTPAKLPPGVRAVRADLARAGAEDLTEAVRGADAVLWGGEEDYYRI
jgi:putative NADH-flavin reductase